MPDITSVCSGRTRSSFFAPLKNPTSPDRRTAICLLFVSSRISRETSWGRYSFTVRCPGAATASSMRPAPISRSACRQYSAASCVMVLQSLLPIPIPITAILLSALSAVSFASCSFSARERSGNLFFRISRHSDSEIPCSCDGRPMISRRQPHLSAAVFFSLNPPAVPVSLVTRTEAPV